MKQCFVWFFLCLSKCGCRNKILRKFAFFPPKPPTYTMRVTKEMSNKKNLSEIQDKQDSVKISSNSLKLYRISSDIITKDVRPYNADILVIEQQSDSFDSPQQINQQIKTPNINLYPPQQLQLINPQGQAIEIDQIEDLKIRAYFTVTKTQNIIPLVLIEPSNHSNYVLIYSHPNSADLGLMLDNFFDLAYNLKINVLAYDYAGYGQSTGKTTDINILADLEATYEFSMNQLGFKWNQIILYGQSIGSGPSVTLAACYKYPIAGLIIHSGLASGLRVLNPRLRNTPYYDIFPNQDYLKYVNCLVYIFHGIADQQISVQQAEELSRNVRNLHCVWFIEDAGHNGIEFESRLVDY